MIKSWRRSATVLAMYAIALHVILLGFSPVAPGAFALINPFALICHTTGPAAKPGAPPPGTTHFIPGRDLGQCTLCSAAAPPPAPVVFHKIDFVSTRIPRVLVPVWLPARLDITANPKLTRGPPFA
jgi:hypothetical protein